MIVIIRKLCAIGTACHFAASFSAVAFGLVLVASSANAQDVDAGDGPGDVAKAVQVPEPVDSENASLTYPRTVSIAKENLLIVDLDLPGVWIKEGDSMKVHTPGTKLLRKPMNRPWCAVGHPSGGILIGDSATREVYYSAEPGDSLVALNNGFLGIPYSIAVDPAGEWIYVGDREKRAVFRLPLQGGVPEEVARVNASALSWDSDGNLWAVTPDAQAVQKIDPATKEVEVVVDGRPYAFPNGLVWAGDRGFVTDTYGNSIWTFTADGKTEKWFEGDPLSRPVGITADDQFLYVADPEKKQVFRFDLKTKAVEPVLK